MFANTAGIALASMSNPWASKGQGSAEGGTLAQAIYAHQDAPFGGCDCQRDVWDAICRQACQNSGGIGCSGEKPRTTLGEDPWGSESTLSAKVDPCQYHAITGPNSNGYCTGVCSCKTPTGTQVVSHDYPCKQSGA